MRGITEPHQSWRRTGRVIRSATDGNGTKPAKDVDDYIAKAPREARAKLRQVRTAIRQAAPLASESISYGMAYYSYKGRLAWFGLHAHHIGLYLRPPVVADHEKELAGYTTTKSAVHLPLERAVPVALVRKLVKARVKINDAEGAR